MARRLSIEAQISGIDLVEQAQTPEEPIQPRPFRNAALGALGFVAAAALAGVCPGGAGGWTPATVLGAALLATIPDLSRWRHGDRATAGQRGR